MSTTPSGLKAKDDLAIDAIGIKKAALLIRAVNHPLRQQILRSIHPQTSAWADQLCKRLQLEQPALSSHLSAGQFIRSA